jgi:hypothetical protein
MRHKRYVSRNLLVRDAVDGGHPASALTVAQRPLMARLSALRSPEQPRSCQAPDGRAGHTAAV